MPTPSSAASPAAPGTSPILHITERPLWEAARASGTYAMSTRGRTLAEEGFIHCSTRGQLPPVAAFLYGSYTGPDELVVLVVDPARLRVPLVYEAMEPGGEEFPHVYGPIPVDAVVDVEPWGVPGAVSAEALKGLTEGYHARAVRPLGTREISGHLVKTYAVEAPGRSVTAADEAAAVHVAGGHLALGASRGSLGLAVLLVHAGGDGDYVLVHTWIEGYMSDLAVFVGPAGRPDELRPGRLGLAPCVWEAAVLAHERDAFTRRVLDAEGPLGERLAAWGGDVLRGEVR
jgi:uncharacterized protein (DUF952 family)